MQLDLFQSLKLIFDDVRNDYSGIGMEVLTLPTSVEQPDIDNDDCNKGIRKRKRFDDEPIDDEVHLELKGKKIRVEILNTICDNLVGYNT